jgi:hypothetical protein
LQNLPAPTLLSRSLQICCFATLNLNFVYSGFEHFDLSAYYTRFDITNARVVSNKNIGFRLDGNIRSIKT